MIALIRRWFDRLNAEPLPVLQIQPTLVLEPNPKIRQAVVRAELQKMDRAEINRALELFHEHYLADMAKAARSRAEGEPVRVVTEHEAPLAVIRGMAALMASLDEEVKVMAYEPKKGLLNG